ncbi:MAG: hypothetical protein ACLPVF_08340 [Acidimicrobiales bacterium]
MTDRSRGTTVAVGSVHQTTVPGGTVARTSVPPGGTEVSDAAG